MSFELNWDELIEVYFSALTTREKYTQLYGVLDRACCQLTDGLTTHYNSLYTRLQALCRMSGLQLRPIDTMRWRARQVKLGLYEAKDDELLEDVAVLCQALSRFTQTPVPSRLRQALPKIVSVSKPSGAPRRNNYKRLRLTVVSRDEQFIYGRTADNPSSDVLKVDFSANEHTRQTAQYVVEDMQVNCVECHEVENSVLRPAIIVIEPDYLVEVSALTACVRPYGASPFNYLLRKFDTRSVSRAILLGHVANQMLDDCIHHPDVTPQQSILTVFRNHLLDFCTVEGIDAQFFDDCSQQFQNIRSILNSLKISPGSAQLEPSFFCETLGLQGRFDLLAADYSLLIELKSGKWNEARQTVLREHLLQMLLYKEILFYNLGIRRGECAGYLFYSKYPYLLEQRSSQAVTEELMTLRNKIVVLERWVADGRGREFLSRLHVDALWQDKSLRQSYWVQYFRPEPAHILDTLHSADPLAQDYFYTFLRFVEHEQMLAKVGDNRVESTRGMASLWNVDDDQKIESGDMLTGLTISDQRTDGGLVQALCLCIASAGDCQPNFRSGDSVVLYTKRSAADNVTNKQVVRGIVEKITEKQVWVQLRAACPMPACPLCMEHDHIDSTFRSLYSGLFALLECDADRRELLLCQRRPSQGEFQLIVGPPGTGKTSVTLRRLVAEALSDGQRVMLAAYTNRAVDEICEMLEGLSTVYIRIGNPLSCAEPYQKRLMPEVLAECKRRSDVVSRLQDCRIFVGTVSSLSSHLELMALAPADTLFIDEASQLLEPQLLPLLCRHKGRFVMIGDHKQLPAVVVQSEQRSEVQSEQLRAIGLTNCRNSLFQRLYNWVVSPGFDGQGGAEAFVTHLDRQGRMHPTISDYANHSFYAGRLDIVPLPHQVSDLPYLMFSVEEQWVATRRVGFVDVPLRTDANSRAKTNVDEAVAVVRLVSSLISLHQRNNLPFSVARSLGIIVPFRRQIATVRNLLAKAGIAEAHDILIDTVERYQGSQKDIIIYDTTVSHRWELDMLSNIVTMDDGTQVDRKLNVAVTRAREQFFMVGNRSLLVQNPLYASLVQYLETNYPEHR